MTHAKKIAAVAGLGLMLAGCAIGHSDSPGRPSSDRTATVPILMYHHICDLDPKTDEVMRTWSVSVKDFTAQMDWLLEHGYHTIRLSQLADHLTRGVALPEKPIVLTFDDGWDIGYSIAYPTLKQRHFIGTFFVYPAGIGENPGSGYMTWSQLKEMADAGMEIAAHTVSHPHLRNIPQDAQRHEIADEKTTIEKRIGHQVDAFAYPFGEFDESIITLVKTTGYRCAVGIEPGYTQRASDLFTLHRTRISYGDTIDTFKEQVGKP